MKMFYLTLMLLFTHNFSSATLEEDPNESRFNIMSSRDDKKIEEELKQLIKNKTNFDVNIELLFSIYQTREAEKSEKEKAALLEKFNSIEMESKTTKQAFFDKMKEKEEKDLTEDQTSLINLLKVEQNGKDNIFGHCGKASSDQFCGFIYAFWFFVGPNNTIKAGNFYMINKDLSNSWLLYSSSDFIKQKDQNTNVIIIESA